MAKALDEFAVGTAGFGPGTTGEGIPYRRKGMAPGGGLTAPHSTFEHFLADLSAHFAMVAFDDLENEIGQWLDRLAQQLGAESCSVGEIYESSDEPRRLLQWPVGNHPARLTKLRLIPNTAA